MKPDRYRSTEERLGQACNKLLPFTAQLAASAVAYRAGLTVAQLLGYACRVSCATPLLGPCMGMLGVGFASALAGHASRHAQKALTTGQNPLRAGFWERPGMDDLLSDAALGAVLFKVLGGRFSRVMPSDISKPGALAFESIPARSDNSEAYAQQSVKRELARIFSRDGCHHCGSRRGPVIGDHMPPNKLLANARKKDALQVLDKLPGMRKVREMIGLGGKGSRPVQRFYPQCQSCSIKQASAVRNNKTVLVIHLRWPPHHSEHLAGILAGLRHNIPPAGPPRRWMHRKNQLADVSEAETPVQRLGCWQQSLSGTATDLGQHWS